MLILVQYSCQEENSVEYKIRGEDYKYWLLIRHEPEFLINVWAEEGYVYMIFHYFDKNGKHYIFFKNHLASRLEKNDFKGSDVLLGDDWKLINDSTIKIQSYDSYKIEELSDDIMILYDSLNDRRTLFIAAPDSLIPKEFHTLQ